MKKNLLYLLGAVIILTSYSYGAELILFDGEKGIVNYTKKEKIQDDFVGKYTGNPQGYGLNLVLGNNTDWSKYKALSFRFYSKNEDSFDMMLCCASESKENAGKGNYYYYKLHYKGIGWQTFVIPFDKFTVSRKPLGWNKVSSFSINLKGWGISNNPKGEYAIDDIMLLETMSNEVVESKKQVKQTKEVVKATKEAKPLLLPINIGETVFEPFWDQNISQFEDWQFENRSKNLKKGQNWDSCSAIWSDGDIVMSKKMKLNVSEYDRLILSLTVANNVTFSAEIYTDNGVVKSDIFKGAEDKNRNEFEVKFSGAKEITELKLTFSAQGEGSAYFRWFGLKNDEKHNSWVNYWNNFENINWSKHLAEDSAVYHYNPAYGLSINNEELQKLREYYKAYTTKTGESPLRDYADYILRLDPPEKLIREYASCEQRYMRFADWQKMKKSGIVAFPALNIAFVGMILEDKEVLNLAARYALALAACESWSAGSISSIVGSTFDHRSFDESAFTQHIALTLDFAHEAFSSAGKVYLLRAIAERGIANINYVAWRYEYIFNCNQLAAFSNGRVAGYMVLEKNWKHVNPYTDLAIRELNSSMDHVLPVDGGFGEGPAYFQYTIETAIPAYYYYAHGRKKPLDSVLPKGFGASYDYVDLFASTDESQYYIPVSDANGIAKDKLALLTNMFLAKNNPKSQAVRLVNRYLANTKKLSSYPWLWMFIAQIPSDNPEYREFVKINALNSASSIRKIGKNIIKVLAKGDMEKGGHKHEDAGMFVLEFGGETYAMDSDSFFYASPWAATLKQCQYHNILLPIGDFAGERPAPKLNIKTPLEGNGDSVNLNLKMDLSETWGEYFSLKTREWISSATDKLTIRDEYKLIKGDGVEFRWLTQLPVTLKDNKFTIQGKNGYIDITPPENTIIQIKKLPFINDETISAISIIDKRKSGILDVEVEFFNSENTL